ncbi:HD domain-containing protein [bacterium]|nr:HD domain-containing protein [bacterium]
MSITIQEKIKSDKILAKIACEFPDAEIYAVGGIVRDYYMGIDSYDRDLIVLNEDAKEFALKLHEIFDSAYIPLDEENKIYRLVLKDSENIHNPEMIDVTNPVEGSLERDLMRRDLTINSIAVNIKTGEVVDMFGGVADIKNKTLNYIEEINFIDDPLRLLRVYRFQSVFGFELGSDTIMAVCKHSDLIAQPAKERVLYELMKLFNGKHTAAALLNMNKTWLLEEIFPVVKEMKQVPPNSHHHLDLLHHVIETVNQIQMLYEQSDDRVKEHLDRIDFGGFSRLAHLKLAGFLHDIGKFSTWTIDKETGRHRFIKHDDVGSKMVKPLLKELTCSNKQIEYVADMIKNHIYPSALMNEEDVNEKAMMRFFRKLGDNVIDDIILAKADRLSARGEAISDEMVERNMANLDKLLNFYFESSEKLAPLPKLLSGNDVMSILGIEPGPKLGEIIDALYEAQLDGDVVTKDDAVDFVKKFNS